MIHTIAKKKKGKASWVKKTLASAALVATLTSGLAVTQPAQATTTFTVNSTTDKLDSKVGDGFCLTGQAQECTVRAAIQEANVTPGADVINFNIFGSGVKTIKVNSNFNGGLPTITEEVSIDGYTQAGASPNTSSKGTNDKLMVQLDGAAVSPATNGLNIAASNSIVRGLIINRFSSHGVVINGSGNRVEGNLIGTDASGTRDRGNSGNGVDIANGSNNTIGGSTRAARNLISGNGIDGVDVNSQGNRVQNDLVGTKRDGITALGNTSSGVAVSNNASGVGILNNSVFSNGGLGIDLGRDGATPNDLNDADAGSNALQNKPVITSAKTSDTATTVKGRLNSGSGTFFTIQFFSNPTGNEGRTFIGQTTVSTDASGNVSFVFKPKKRVPVGQKITATATRNFTGDTSEFSAPRKVVAS